MCASPIFSDKVMLPGITYGMWYSVCVPMAVTAITKIEEVALNLSSMIVNGVAYHLLITSDKGSVPHK